MENTRLIRTCVDSDPHSLVLRPLGTETSALDLLFDSVAPERPTDALAVTDDGTEGLLEAWTTQTGQRPRNIGMVSVGERMRSAAASPASAAPPGDIVQGVAEPTDTDAIRDAVTGYLDMWPDDGRTVVYFDSMASLLDGLSTDETTEFLGELLRALDARDAVGYVCLTPESHDPAVVREVASLFDTVVECTGDATEAITEPSVSDCFDALANSRRRYVLAAALDGGPIAVDALANGIAARSSVERESVQVSLLNVHLPKLADLGLVSYERDAERVEPGYHFGRVEPYLRQAIEIAGEQSD